MSGSELGRNRLFDVARGVFDFHGGADIDAGVDLALAKAVNDGARGQAAR